MGATLNGSSFWTQDDGILDPYAPSSRQYVFPFSVRFNKSLQGYHVELVGIENAVNTNTGMLSYGNNWVTFKTDTNDNGMTNYQAGDSSFHNATYVIRYVPNTYTVNYDGNGATSGSMGASTVAYNQWLTLGNNFTKQYIAQYDANGGSVSKTSEAAPCAFQGWCDGNDFTYNGTTYHWWTFEAPYYANAHSDTMAAYGYNKAALLQHFDSYTAHGTAYYKSSAVFDLGYYVNFGGSDLRALFGGNVYSYLSHWNTNGYNEHRIGTSGGYDTSVSDTYPYGSNVANLTDVNDGSVTLTAKWGNASVTLPTPTRAGYTFKGWSTDRNATSGYSAGQTIGISSNVKLYAIWSVDNYTVTFDGNGGTPTAMSRIVTYGTGDWNRGASKATRTGYTFDGWYTEKSGGVKVYDANGDAVTSSGYWRGNGSSAVWERAGNVTLYAHWIPNTYVVSYNANGGTGAMSNTSCTYDAVTTLQMNTFTRTGYTFVGWNTNANGTGTSYADKASVQNMTTTNGGTVTLYAQWTPNNYAITFDANGGETSLTALSVTYDDTNNNNVSSGNLIRRGYTFAGWYDAKSGGSKVYDATGACTNEGTYFKDSKWHYTDNVTLYARWIANKYTIKFDANDGETSLTELCVTYDSEQNNDIGSDSATRTGYIFDGWYTDKTDGVQIYDASGKCVNDGTYFKDSKWHHITDIQLYAHWTPITYTIQFDGNAENGTGVVTGSMSPVTVTYDSLMNLPLNAFSKVTAGNVEYKDGEIVSRPSTFLGWSTDPTTLVPVYRDGEGVLNLSSTQNDVIMFYAIWDDCPNFMIGEFPDRFFTLEEAQRGDITEEELLSMVSAQDRETNPLETHTSSEVAATGSDVGITLYNFDMNEFTSLTSPANISVTYKVKDITGNVSYLTVTVYVTSNDPSQRLSVDYIRNVSEKYYDKSEEYGGLNPASLWVTNDFYKQMLRDVLTQTDTVYQRSFSADDLKNIREYVNNHGLGNSEESDALQNLFDNY